MNETRAHTSIDPKTSTDFKLSSDLKIAKVEAFRLKLP